MNSRPPLLTNVFHPVRFVGNKSVLDHCISKRQKGRDVERRRNTQMGSSTADVTVLARESRRRQRPATCSSPARLARPTVFDDWSSAAALHVDRPNAIPREAGWLGDANTSARASTHLAFRQLIEEVLVQWRQSSRFRRLIERRALIVEPSLL